MLRTRITKAEAGVDLADRMDSPNFMVGGSWMITGGTAMPVEDAGKDPVALMFGLSIPIYREKYRSIESSSRQMHRSLIKAFHDKENSVRSDAQILLRDINSFNRKVELFDTRLISKARQAYEVTRSAFQSGTANFADLLEGVRLLLDLEGSMEKASVQKAKHISKLLLLFGNTLTFSQEK